MKDRRKYRRRFFRGWVLTLLWATLSSGILLNAYESHINFRESITGIFNEQQLLNVHLFQRMLLDHIKEAAESLKHASSMIRDSRGSIPEVAGMLLRDHADDFSSVSVISPEGNLLFHTLGVEGRNPYAFSEREDKSLDDTWEPFMSKRIFDDGGDPSTYLFAPFQSGGTASGRHYIVGEIRLRSFLSSGMDSYRGRNISFVIAEEAGAIYYIANITHQKRELMERGHLFPLDESCLGCHAREAFDDLARTVETNETVHAVYENPDGLLLNRTSSLVGILDEKWLVSVSVPYDSLQGQIDRNFNRNAAAAMLLLFLAGSGSLLLYLNSKQRDLEHHYYSIVDSIGVGLCRIDGEGMVLSANPALKTLLGVEGGEIIEGKFLREYCVYPGMCEGFVKTVVEGSPVTECELEMMRRGFSSFYALFTAKADRGPANSFRHIDLVVSDISDRKNAEANLKVAKEELEKQNEELKKIDRIKDALIGDVSHELKTPVAKLVMHLEILRHVHENFGISDKTSDIMDVMEANIRRQQNVIKNILMTSRLEAGGRTFRLDAVRLDKLIEGVVGDHMHSLAAHGIRVEQSLTEAVVEVDEEMLWHVLSNLIDNAIKYRAGDSPRLGIAMEVQGNEIVVRIADNGVGLSEEERKKVFERFYQSRTSTEGIGLGLYICLSILERMGGSLALQSEGRSKGTTAEIRLPRG